MQRAVPQVLRSVRASSSWTAAGLQPACGVTYEVPDATKPPVVFIHGFLGSSSNFRTVARHVSSESGRSAFSIDLRNHGSSPHSDDMGFDSMAADVAVFLESRGIPKATLVGHSLGGKVAMTAALNAPEMVEQVVSVDMSPKSYDVKAPSTRTVGSIVKGIKSIDIAAAESKEDVASQMATFIPDPLILGFVMQNVVPDPDASTPGGPQRFKWRLYMPGITKWLGPMLEFRDPPSSPSPVPAVFISGGLSDYCTPDHDPLLSQFFQSPIHHIIPDAGHYVHAEKRAEFVSTLLSELL